MSKIKLPKDLRTKWLKALRSGDYKQADSVLKSLNGGYCCLGVICEEQKVPGNYSCSIPNMLKDPHKLLPPVLLTSWDDSFHIYMRDNINKKNYKEPEITEENFVTYLACLNDHVGLNFEQIADVIEEITIEE